MKVTQFCLSCVTLTAWCGVLTAQDAPEVLLLDPPHLAIDVIASSNKVLTIQFDQDMDPDAVALCGGGLSFPTISEQTWHDRRTLLLAVELEPDRAYAMDLSCAGHDGFRSATGMRLRPTPWRFATKGPDIEASTREAAIDRLFLALRDHYSYRDRLAIDWGEFEQRTRPSLSKAPYLAALAVQMAEALSMPQDPHISMVYQGGRIPTFQRHARQNFDVSAVQRTLPQLHRIGNIGLQGRTGDGVGYLMISSFAREHRRDFELCLGALRQMSDCKSIVLDVRTNIGGDEALALKLAGFFVTGQKVYAAHRIRDARSADGFGRRQERTIRGHAPPDVYTGRVAVLMGPLNIAHCEDFLLMMKQAERAVLIGDNSYGSSGNPKQVALAAGLAVSLPTWQALRPDGTCFEGEGIEPTITIAMPEHALGREDRVLDEALARLRDPR